MKAVTVKELRQELELRSAKELQDLCLRLSRFKKENKELLTYLLFESANENAFIDSVKEFIDGQFETINSTSFYYIRKSVRRILSNTKKFIRYSGKKETEVELLIHFCRKLKSFRPSIAGSARLQNTYDRQIGLIRKAISTLHKDLQYDYNEALAVLDEH